MKTKEERFIADGRTFKTYEEVEKYARENHYRITNTQAVNHGTKLVIHFIDLTSNK
jgi:hypothetical protein